MARENAVVVEDFELNFDEEVVIRNDQNITNHVRRPYYGNKPSIDREVFLRDEPVKLGFISFLKALGMAYLNNIDRFMVPAAFIFKSLFKNFVIVSKFLIVVASGVALTVALMMFAPSVKALFASIQPFVIEYWFYASIFFIANMFFIFNVFVAYRAIAFIVKSLYVSVIKESLPN